MIIAAIDKKGETIVLVGQVLQFNFHGFGIGLIHVVYKKGAEVAGNDPPGMLGARKAGNIFLGLLEGGVNATKVHLLTFFHVSAKRLLLDEHQS